MRNIVYLSLGSNVGNRTENIISALSLLQSNEFVNIKKISSFYETSPIGPNQRNFYNVVINANTNLNPKELLSLIKQIEKFIGRVDTIHWGPRVIDIDILFFNKNVFSNKCLTIPHKEIQNRLFILIPLSEIDKNFIHPIFKKKVSDILNEKLLTLRWQKVKIL
jgi:2-amino-4-hydroxy-6-hydroxymethyldihydropteridine diphosphokinase